MFLTNFKRIIRTGFINFWRNSFVTAASILVMTTTLFVLGSFVFLDAMLDQTLENIAERVDINVYFEPDVSETEILAVRDAIADQPQVAEVFYLSQDEVLDDFKLKNKDDEVINEALDEIDGNPLGATLNVLATDPSLYEEINTFIESDATLSSSGEEIISDVNFRRNSDAIDRLTSIIATVDFLSIAVLVFFALISVLITFNTVRLAIYNSRDEISVMKLVGASNTYIRGPFVVEGVMYGIASALIALILFYPLTLWIGDSAATFFGSRNLLDYYIDNFSSFFVILTVTGVVLGSISSFAAVKKYLKN